MKFNLLEITEFAMRPGDQEGRMTHKPPTRSLYDTAYKERWFKLKGNLLFYYRLNDEGVVEKNEPNGCFVLENITIERDEEDLRCSFGFTITWKDDPFRRHGFYTLSEGALQTWITKLISASYENMRAELLVLRLKIKQKSGKDPLEHLGTSLPICALRGVLVSSSKATSSSMHHGLSLSSSDVGLAVHRDVGKSRISPHPSPPKSAPSTPSVSAKFGVAIDPIPPPRVNRNRRRSKASSVAIGENTKKIGPSDVSFRSHINRASSNLVESPSESYGLFKSHIKNELTKEEIENFLT